MICPSWWEQEVEAYQVKDKDPNGLGGGQEWQKTGLFSVSLLSDWELLPRGHMSLLDWNWKEACGHLAISNGFAHSPSPQHLTPASALNPSKVSQTCSCMVPGTPVYSSSYLSLQGFHLWIYNQLLPIAPPLWSEVFIPQICETRIPKPLARVGFGSSWVFWDLAAYNGKSSWVEHLAPFLNHVPLVPCHSDIWMFM